MAAPGANAVADHEHLDKLMGQDNGGEPEDSRGGVPGLQRKAAQQLA